MKETFPRVSDSKSPQIRTLLRDGNFEDLVIQIEKSEWKSFKSVLKKFVGNCNAPNYREIVGELLQSHQDIVCNMSLKRHFLDSHLD